VAQAVSAINSDGGGFDRRATYSRAVAIVDVLANYRVCDERTFDRRRAERFLKNVRDLDPNDGEALIPILDWVSDHGQSLDWIFCGDPGVMIWRAARCHLTLYGAGPASLAQQNISFDILCGTADSFHHCVRKGG